MTTCISCEDEPIELPLQIFVPIRGEVEVDHDDNTPRTIVNISLPADELVENLMVTLTGRNAAGTVKVAHQLPIMISNRLADTPNAYEFEEGSASVMNGQDSDLEYDFVQNGDIGVSLRMTDTSGDAGVMKYTFQVWTMDQLLLV